MILKIHPIDPKWVAHIRAGGLDANGQAAERAISEGGGTPCRHCLDFIPKGEAMLILAARPFPHPQPYAETRPIFLCEKACAPYAGARMPPVGRGEGAALVKGYTDDYRILYGTGAIVPRTDLPTHCAALFEQGEVAFIDVRSAVNNCFTFRITRGGVDKVAS